MMFASIFSLSVPKSEISFFPDSRILTWCGRKAEAPDSPLDRDFRMRLCVTIAGIHHWFCLVGFGFGPFERLLLFLHFKLFKTLQTRVWAECCREKEQSRAREIRGLYRKEEHRLERKGKPEMRTGAHSGL